MNQRFDALGPDGETYENLEPGDITALLAAGRLVASSQVRPSHQPDAKWKRLTHYFTIPASLAGQLYQTITCPRCEATHQIKPRAALGTSGIITVLLGVLASLIGGLTCLAFLEPALEHGLFTFIFLVGLIILGTGLCAMFFGFTLKRSTYHCPTCQHRF